MFSKILGTTQRADGAWAYHGDGKGSVEATVLALLALTCAGSFEDAVRSGLQWLCRCQNSDGSLGLSLEIRQPTWPTSHAALAFSCAIGFEKEQQRAIKCLLDFDSAHWERKPTDVGSLDPSIPGWPWWNGTFAWIEPTAWALMALARAGKAGHQRAVDGRRLLVDRAIPGGGWNYGNAMLFGTALRPQPCLTALALLGLAAGGKCARTLPCVEQGLAYLQHCVSTLTTPRSLALSVLALRAWGEGSTVATIDVHRCSDTKAPYLLAYLQLATAEQSLRLLGCEEGRS